MWSLAIILIGFVVYALFSRRLKPTILTGPILFTVFGLLIGPEGLGILDLELEDDIIQIILELTLVIVLFSDAVAIDYRAIRKEAFLPTRLLGIGLPLTILTGVLVALVLTENVGFWEAMVIAVILAPTDAALGRAVVESDAVPDMIRQGLSVESGLNDGIAVPFLTISLAAAAGQMSTPLETLTVFAEEIGWALVAGIGIGAVGGWAVRWSTQRGYINRNWRQVSVATLAVLSFTVADLLGGSGFIAAFVGGLAFGAFVRRVDPQVCEFSDGIGGVLTLLAFFIFGGLILGPAIPDIGWQAIVYGVASLTIVRMVPVAVSLLGTGLRRRSVTYVAWFGPRGLASLVFAGTAVVQTDPEQAPVILSVVATAVVMSVLAHGMTSVPLSNRYGAWFAKAVEQEPEMVEALDVSVMPSVRRMGSDVM